MSIRDHVRDGASLRQKRMQDLVAFVDQAERGVHITGVEAHMTLLHGMKRSTTREYVRDLSLAGVLVLTQESVVRIGKLPYEWSPEDPK